MLCDAKKKKDLVMAGNIRYLSHGRKTRKKNTQFNFFIKQIEYEYAETAFTNAFRSVTLRHPFNTCSHLKHQKLSTPSKQLLKHTVVDFSTVRRKTKDAELSLNLERR